MNLHRLPIIALLAVLAAFAAPATASNPPVAVSIPRAIDIDATGVSLRRALNAFEEARDGGIPQSWTRLQLAQGATVTLATRLLLRVDAVGDDTVRLMVVGDAGPQAGDLGLGQELTLEPLRFLLVRADPRSGAADLMMIAASPSPVLSDRADRGASPVSITAEDAARRIVVAGGDEETLAFAREFLRLLATGLDAETAAQRARDKHPARLRNLVSSAALVPVGVPVSRGYGETGYGAATSEEPAFAAGVTLCLVRGESSALRQLSTGWAYDSRGRNPEQPRVGARSNRDGGATVTYGSPGDAFQARLQALESSGSVHVESSTYLYVPLDGGTASFQIAGTQASASGYISAQRTGRDSVVLDVTTSNADRSSLGSISTRVRVRDGGTVRLGGSTTTITRSSSSNAPIIGSVPYIGPLSGNSQSSSYASDYALFATVQLQ